MRLARAVALSVLATVAGATSALAVTVVDFTDQSPWAGVSGLTSFTSSGIRITSAGGAMTFNSSASERAGCLAAGAGLACDGDGIGIVDDEIGGTREMLLLEFLAGPVNILDVHLLDLFRLEGNPPLDERVALSTDGVTFTLFAAGPLAGTTGGYRETGFTATGVTRLWLLGASDPVSDLALARIAYEPVPEPTTLALLGLGLTGIGLRARRRAR